MVVLILFSSPANIAGSRYRWDVNLAGVNVGVSNNELGDVSTALGEGTIKGQLFSQSK